MNRTKDFRRHQERKHKREAIERLKEWSIFDETWQDPRNIGVMATTPQRCSCIGCGGQRKWEGMTLDEKRNYLNLLDELVLDKSGEV